MAGIDDAMNEVKKALETNPNLSIDEALEIVTQSARSLPGLQEKINKIQMARGAILETSTHIEKVFDEVIILTGNPQLVHTKRFMQKAKFIRTLMETLDPNEEEITKAFLDKMEQVVTIRNLFAHVPIDLSPLDIEFDSSPRYHGYYNGDLRLKDVKKSTGIFMGSAQEIMDKTIVFIKRVQKEAQRQQEFLMEIYKMWQDIEAEEAEEEK